MKSKALSFIRSILALIVLICALFSFCSCSLFGPTSPSTDRMRDDILDYYRVNDLLDHVYGRYGNLLYESLALVDNVSVVGEEIFLNQDCVMIKATVIEDYYNIMQPEEKILIPILLPLENGDSLKIEDLSSITSAESFLVHTRVIHKGSSPIDEDFSPEYVTDDGYQTVDFLRIDYGEILPLKDGKLDIKSVDAVGEKYGFEKLSTSIENFSEYFKDEMSIEELADSARQLEFDQEIKFTKTHTRTAKMILEQISPPSDESGLIIELADVDPYLEYISFKVTNTTENEITTTSCEFEIEETTDEEIRYVNYGCDQKTVTIKPNESAILTLYNFPFVKPCTAKITLIYKSGSVFLGTYSIKNHTEQTK